MILADFSGGLNTRLSPNLIGVTESIICNNVDLSQGKITPLRSPKATSNIIPIGEESFTRFKGSYISNNIQTSYVEFNDALYFTDGVSTVKKSLTGLDIYELGLDAPTTAPSVELNTVEFTFVFSNLVGGDISGFPSGSYTYLIAYKTDSGSINYKETTFDYTGNAGVQCTLSSFDNLSYVRLYRLYNSKYRLVQEIFSGTVMVDTKYDISTQPSSTPYSEPLGKRFYLYTYLSSVTGVESGPSLASVEIDVDFNNVKVSGFVASTDPTVDTIVIYRLGGRLTSYYKVSNISNSATFFIDNKSDIEVLENGLLETNGYSKPKVGLKYLTEYNSTLFAVIGSTLYFSNNGLVDIWKDINFIEMPEVITGMGSTQNGLLIFSRNKTWILTGSDLTNFAKFMLSGNQGCISHNSISYVDNRLFWLGLDGICTSAGGAIEVLSWPKLGKLNITPIKSVVYDNQYILFHSTGMLGVDFRNGVKLFTSDILARGAYYSPDFDKLYLLKPSDNLMYSYNEGSSLLNYNYKTGWIAENGSTNYKTYKNIYIYSLGSGSVKVFLDNTLVTTLQLVNGLNDIKLPQSNTKGYFISFEFIGTNDIIEVSLVSEGRQNGR